ncbi:hypothetical protein WT53_02760 [Burkholderia sp. MSMB2157WGS]|nr:hypothetical protein WT53_02760 [Burkholderia sp. MSMB2157WGS]
MPLVELHRVVPRQHGRVNAERGEKCLPGIGRQHVDLHAGRAQCMHEQFRAHQMAAGVGRREIDDVRSHARG